MDNGICNAKIENNIKTDSNPSNLNNLNEKFSNTQITIYFFWASWCPHCVSFKPIFEEFENKVSNNQNIKINKVQCDENTQEVLDYVQKYNIEGFPSVIIVNSDDTFKHYEGKRNLSGLMNILPSDENNNKEKFTNSETDSVSVYNFNTSWCGYSRKFQPVWDQFCDKVKDDNIKTYDIKCDEANNELCKKYNIRAYPTVIIVRNTDFKTYDGPRTVDDLVKSVNNKEVQVKVNENQGKTIVYNFNTEWCGFSKMFQPVWNTFSNSLKESQNVVAIDVKCDNDSNAELCSRYNIEGYPSVVVVNDSGVELYNGPRTVEGLKTFLRIN
jgi:thiol-disulfide isomerase/thioredoxin